jgi:hypothetical protein
MTRVLGRLRIAEVDDGNQTLATVPSSEELSLCSVHNTHSSQCVVLHQNSSTSNIDHCIHDDLLQLQEQLQRLNQRTLQMQLQIEELQQAQSSEQRSQGRTDEVERSSQSSEYQTRQQWQQQSVRASNSSKIPSIVTVLFTIASNNILAHLWRTCRPPGYLSFFQRTLA